MAMYNIVATTAFGIESVAAKELKALGYNDLNVENGKVTFEGDESAICLSNLWLRCVDRVYIKLGEFKATTFEQLFQGVKKINWSDYLPEDAEFPISDAKSVKSKLFSLSDIQSISKKAIVENLKETYKTNWFNENGSLYPIHVSIHKDIVTVLLNTSGPALHRRGYREQGNIAPLKETLAAALIKISGWTKEYPLIDPFCGSGTILIEAAMLARNIAPGINRKFAFENWSLIPQDLFKKIKKEAYEAIDYESELKLLGYDIHWKSCKIARENCELAGVDDSVHIQEMDMRDLSNKRKFGYIICNPPYGERISDLKEIKVLYKDMGKAFSELKYWNKFILTSNEDFQIYFARRSDKNRKLYNGRLKCYFYQYFDEKRK